MTPGDKRGDAGSKADEVDANAAIERVKAAANSRFRSIICGLGVLS